MKNLVSKLSSRKLWVSVSTMAIVFGARFLGIELSDVQLATLAASGMAYVIAEAVVDAVAALTPKAAAPNVTPPTDTSAAT